MTPRVEAWIRQAQNDLEAARFTAGQGFHAQACCWQPESHRHTATRSRNWWSYCNSRA